MLGAPLSSAHPVHIIGVSLDLGGGRRGVDMGPSALRIAGIGERLAGLPGRRQGQPDRANPGNEGAGRGQQEIYP